MVIAEPKPKPPNCDTCGQVIDSEETMWQGKCPTYPAWGHSLNYDGLMALNTYLEAQGATA